MGEVVEFRPATRKELERRFWAAHDALEEGEPVEWSDLPPEEPEPPRAA